MKTIYNPYLPPDTYIPDGEPHVFGDRVYVFGSHDKEGGEQFCMLDYEVWSAPTDDLGDWRCEGTIYRAAQDPDYGKPNRHMYAPDVVQGCDGRYYLYYAMSGGEFTGPIHVAVCDSPAGSYEYYGCVRQADGTVFRRNITFDPGVLNDNGTIWLYYGWSLAVDDRPIPAADDRSEEAQAFRRQLLQAQEMLFGKTQEEIAAEPDGIMGANAVRLADDMVTVQGEPRRIVPGQFDATGTSFAGHAFFEGSSIRKIGDTYYFIYSSEKQHELCYATSAYPDRDFRYGGVLVSNGDIGYQGRQAADRVAATGNNHGSIEQIGGQWYVFYHRQTHKTSFSRQGCAEPIEIAPDGSIAQVELTSQGLYGKPLPGRGVYPATIACVLTDGKMPHMVQKEWPERIPNVNHEGEHRFIQDIGDGVTVGYKYFSFAGETTVTLRLRGDAEGTLTVWAKPRGAAGEGASAALPLTASPSWTEQTVSLHAKGDCALYLRFAGKGYFDLETIAFGAA